MQVQEGLLHRWTPIVHFPTNTTSTKAQMVKYRQCVNDMNVLLLSYSH